ncbi:hypothetical protein PV08_09665 [Exophiala spinifera]|uniref:HhH-GPD domain-containing protein n=1 Tax=Exophiala spinifera TaxID=91928 RepID=A0A0D2B0A2_9EURO|nr:uncharacterized protein PV08_09665 [Exophiala spinifera]KIW12388.1 hypothetical protein PV08_09665 [Exophiala spinifera]
MGSFPPTPTSTQRDVARPNVQTYDNTEDWHAFPSPPPSPLFDRELPVVPTNGSGMITSDSSIGNDKSAPAPETAKKNIRSQRRKVTYVSRHFTTDGSSVDSSRTERQLNHALKKVSTAIDDIRKIVRVETCTLASSPGSLASHTGSRIYYGVNIDELSSDSDLTDVPDDIGPDPFISTTNENSTSEVLSKPTKPPRRPTKSPYFPHPHKHRPTFLSTLPFPPLSHATFGLMQERLAHDPFRLLIATIFLNKTPGERAMPVFYELMSRYPTPLALSNAEVSDITSLIYVLGFQNQRARKCVAMARAWVDRPPERGKRYRKLHYPARGDGKDVGVDEAIGDEDARVAWEISHLPGLGPYSHDSWRMFCRDQLRGLSTGWNGEGSVNKDHAHADSQEEPHSFEPEWKRVVPLDKELRAWLTWMWMKEGWVWNKETGQRQRASDDLMAIANGGGIVVEEKDSDHLIVKSVGEEHVTDLQGLKKVERTVGDFLPGI